MTELTAWVSDAVWRDTLPMAAFTPEARKVAEERYLIRRPDGTVETVEDMLWRTAVAVAEAEDNNKHEWAKTFYTDMAECRFLPNSPTLMNAGTGNGHQLSACYVLPVEDSLDAITDALKWQAKVLASGGGTGFAFSRLRPKGTSVGSTQGVAGGPVSFLQLFDEMSGKIKQGGKRAGANMGILRVDHPDILEFINCKSNGGLTNFNISVGITNAFMAALEGQNAHGATQDHTYALVDPHTQEVVERLDARDVWTSICTAAWETGDPGLVFLDRINDSTSNPVPSAFQIEATNPCGEQPLAPFDACNLGSINLAKHVAEDSNGKLGVNFTMLRFTVRNAVRFLDDVITINPYPLPQIAAMVHSLRRIGLGVMGWADLLYQLNIPYDSAEAVKLAEKVMSFITDAAKLESGRLAEERGVFPLFDQSIYKNGPPLRNAARTTIAPTGSISILAGCSSGIEPVYALAMRHTMFDRIHDRDIVLPSVNSIFEEHMRQNGTNTEDLFQRLAAVGILSRLPDADVPDEIRSVFKTAHEIAPSWHVRMQAAFQAHTDNGVSKTVNLPNDASASDIDDIYRMAWDTGCMGITVYRTGSKDKEVLYFGTDTPRDTAQNTDPVAPVLRQHPDTLDGRTYRVESPLGTVFVTIGSDVDGPLAVFVKSSKAGSETGAITEAIGRLISATLRIPSSMSPAERLRLVEDQLQGIGGDRPIGFGEERVRSLPDSVAKALAKELQLYFPDSGSSTLAAPELFSLCPDCNHATLVHTEGCLKCEHCGYSEC